MIFFLPDGIDSLDDKVGWLICDKLRKNKGLKEFRVVIFRIIEE
jgi:hypothetical protein